MMTTSAKEPQFTHLHVHSEYSLLDGLAKIEELVVAASSYGMTSLAVTDHGAMYGIPEFYLTAQKAGIKPILGCLLAGQEILTAEGVKNVEDVAVGDYVLTHKGRFRRVLSTMRREYKGDGYSVKLGGRYGRPLILTEEHPILVRNRKGDVAWLKPGEIKPGRTSPGVLGLNAWNSWACLPKLAAELTHLDVKHYLPDDFYITEGVVARTQATKYSTDTVWRKFPANLPLSYDVGYLLGIYAAEGYYSNGGIGFSLHRDETHIVDRIKRILLNFGIEVGVYQDKGSNGVELRAGSRVLEYLLPALCGKGAKNKRVPREVLAGTPEVRAGFLQGVLDGDGKDIDCASNIARRRDLKTASRSLAWGVRTLLADIGVWASITEGVARATLPQDGRMPTEKSFKYYTLAYSPERAYSRTVEDDRAVYRPIASVTKMSLDTQVYNFSVEEDNSYVSDFILHNCEAYIVPSLADGHERKNGDYNHMLLFAESNEGYQNLLRLTTLAWTKGFRYKPRIDWEQLATHSTGLIATSGCLAGEIPQLVLSEKVDEAERRLKWYREVFGDRFYLEVQNHEEGGDQDIVNQAIYDLHRRSGLPLVATNDSHYTHASDVIPHDMLLCIQMGKQVTDTNRMKFGSGEYFLKSADRMHNLFRGHEDACRNTLVIAERCNVALQFGQSLLPSYETPDGSSAEHYLYARCQEGLRQRYGMISDEIQRRLDYEFGIIRAKGFVDYFLIVWDYTNYAREQGMRCVARGSVAGSIVAYALGISNADPLRFGIMFERFLNPERNSMPDIDMDFPDDRREEVIRYIAAKYGQDRVAQLITFNRMAAKQAVRDVGRVQGESELADTIARLVPDGAFGKRMTVAVAAAKSDELAKLMNENPKAKEIIEQAGKLDGTVRSTGVHPAGLIISRIPLGELVPLQPRDRKDPDSWLQTGYEHHYLEELGLIKMDCLGLSNLTILQNCLTMIQQNHPYQAPIDLDRIPLDDRKAFELLSAGHTEGIFQLESTPMKRHLRALKPSRIEDIIAMVALYRPGPMNSIPNYIGAKHGQIKPVYAHPLLEPILRDTYGVLVFQDQVLLAARELAGFTWGEVDGFRKGIGKKIAAEIAKYHTKFVDGCAARGMSRQVAEEVYASIEAFADYGFNHAHAVAYATVAYQTAYLKAHYPAEFMAASLSVEAGAGDIKKVTGLVEECRRLGVPIFSPDINRSERDFTTEHVDGAYGVRWGLLGIKGLGDKAVEKILASRRNRPFLSFGDIFERHEGITRAAIKLLIQAGALDSLLNIPIEHIEMRGRYIEQLERDKLSKKKQAELPAIRTPKRESVLHSERDVLGVYVSANPLVLHEAAIRAQKPTLSDDLEPGKDQHVLLIGYVESVAKGQTKGRKQSFARIVLRDLGGATECVVWPDVYKKTQDVWRQGALVRLKAKVTWQDDGTMTVGVMTAMSFEPQEPQIEMPAVVHVDTDQTTLQIIVPIAKQAQVSQVIDILREFPGSHPYEIILELPGGKFMPVPISTSKTTGLTVRSCADLDEKLGVLGLFLDEIA